MDDSVLLEVLGAIEPLDDTAAAAAAARLAPHDDVVAAWVPLAVQLAGIRRRVPPPVERMVVVTLAADVGEADPRLASQAAAVAAGTAPLAALARAVGAKLLAVDCGLAGDTPEGVLALRVAGGSRAPGDAQPAMTDEQAVVALQTGIALTLSLASEGLDVLVLGDLGAASRRVAADWPVDLSSRAQLAARGTLALGVMTGAALAAAAIRVPVLLDGPTGSAARALACALAPAMQDACVLVDGLGAGDGAGATAHLLQVGVAARLLTDLR